MNLFDELEKQQPQAAPAAAPPAAPQGGKVVNLFEEMDSAQKSMAQAANVAVQMGDAAKASRAVEVGAKLGVPSSVVEGDLTGFEQKLAIKNTSSIVANSPTVARWLVTNPHLATAAKNNLPELSALEKVWGAFGRGFAQVLAQDEFTDAMMPALEGQTLTPDQNARVESAQKTMQQLGLDEQAQGPVESAASMTGYGLQTVISGGLAALRGAGYGGAAGAAIGAPIAGVGAAPGFVAGSTVGAAMGMMNYAYRQEAASTYYQFKNLKDIDGKPLDPALARMGAQAAGGINAIIEVSSDYFIARITGLIPGGLPATMAGKQALKGIVSKSIAEGLANPTKRLAMFEAAKKLVASGGVEGLEEFVQNFVTGRVQDVVEKTAGGTFEDRPFAQESKEGLSQAAKAFGSTVLSFGLIGALPVARHMRQINQAQKTQEFYKALGESATESELNKKLPEATKSFIQNLKQGGPIQNAYIGVAEFDAAFQGEGARVAQELGLEEQYVEAKALNADLVIPIETYATKLAGTEFHKVLMPDLRLNQGELSFRETEEVRKRVDKILADEVAGIEKNVKAEEPVRAIYTDVYDQLKGIMGESEAHRNATLWQERYRARSERTGIDALTLYNENPLKVKRDILANPDADVVAQSGIDQTQTTEFKTFFGDSPVVDKDGKPLKLYRGVFGVGSIPEASLNMEARDGYAVFTSTSPAVASSYANPERSEFDKDGRTTGTVVPVYVKATKLIEFDVPRKNGNPVFDMFEFDRQAKLLKPGEVLVARQVYDQGPRARTDLDPDKLYSYPSDIYAFNKGTSVKSAIGNSGAFDPNDPNILKQAGKTDSKVETLIMSAERGDRERGQRATFSEDEKKAIVESAAKLNISEDEIRDTVRRNKLSVPPKQGWEPLVFIRAEVDKGKVVYVYNKVPYGFSHKDGELLKPGTPDYDRRVASIAKSMVEEVRKVAVRADAGDKNAMSIIAQAGWYKAMRARLRHEFGGLGDLFADLLGATSPNTPVRDNWWNAVDALRRASRGDYDTLIAKWVAWDDKINELETDLRGWFNEQMVERGNKVAEVTAILDALTAAHTGTKKALAESPEYKSLKQELKDASSLATQSAVKALPEYQTKLKAISAARELSEDLLPIKESGKLYGFNGRNIARAMVDLWRTIKDAEPLIGRGATAPKALNFSGNLIGFRSKATIDVWAARMLQRLAGMFRIPSMAETGVTGEMRSDASTTKAFGMGQDIFAAATTAIKADASLSKHPELAKLNDDDLQALVWFIEKEIWTINNWTTVAGEGGSFELEANLTGTSKQSRVTELRVMVNASPPTADVKLAATDLTAAREEINKHFADHAAEIAELKAEREKTAATGKKSSKRIGELEKITRPPAEPVSLIKRVESAIARNDAFAAQQKAAQAELVSLERTVDRFYAGISEQMSVGTQGVDYVPTDGDMAVLAQDVTQAVYADDNGSTVLASKALATEGWYYGSPERSLDLEVVAREGYNPITLWKMLLEKARNAKQDAVFMSRVLRDKETPDPKTHRPGVEIYFRERPDTAKLKEIEAALQAKGIGGFTIVVDGRRLPTLLAGAMPAAVGVRFQFVPEFEQRYGGQDFNALSDEELSAKVKEIAKEYAKIAEEVSASIGGVSFASSFWYETNVAFSSEYQEKIDGITTGNAEGATGDIGSAVWRGQSIRSGVESANRQVRETESRESDASVLGGDATGTGIQESDGQGTAAGEQTGEGQRVGGTLLQSSQEQRAKLEANADAIAAMPEDIRDNTEIGDFPGSSDAYNLYEARKMQKKPSEKLKRVTDNNSFALWQNYDYIANVDGEMYGITKQEDPDEVDDETKFIYSFAPLSDPMNDVSTITDDVTELFSEIRKHKGQNLKQPGDRPRGMISIRDNMITLLRGADPSTFLHESGHSWLEEMRRDALRENAPQQIKDDWKTIAKWAGIPENLASDQPIPVAAHEKWATGVEQYVRKGEAPSSELRAAFARFKDWLVRIYRNALDLGVEISPQIKEVMDRMLATDDQISRARESAGMTGETILSPDWMTAAEKSAFGKLLAEAKEQAETTVRTELMNELVRERTDFWKAEKKNVTEEVTDEVNQQPVYIALSALQTGKLPDGREVPGIDPGTKLSRDAIVAQRGEAYLKTLPKPFVYQMEGGLHPDVAAQLFGFKTGGEMLAALSNAPDKKIAIAMEVDARMMERHGDMMNDGSLAERAAEAVANEKQMSVFYREMQILRRNGASGEMISMEMLDKIATDIISGKKIGELSPAYYEHAAEKAGRDAVRALVGKEPNFERKLTAAFEARQRQILNLALFKKATEFKRETQKSLRAWKMLNRSDERLAKNRNMDLVNTARAILANYGIGTSDRSPQSYMEQMKTYDPDTYNDLQPLVDLVDERKPFKELTIDEFHVLKDAVDGLWSLSRSANQMLIDGRRVSKEEVKSELMMRIDDFGMPKVRRGYERAVTDWENTKIRLMGWRSALRRVESWVDSMDDSNPDGAFRKYIWQPISEAADHYREQRKVTLEKYLELVKTVEKSITVDKIDAPEIGYEFGANGSGRAELLGAILHTGNKSNLTKLLAGRGWGTLDQAGNLDTTRWDEFIKRMQDEGILTKTDYDFVQNVWNLLESLKPEAQAAHKEMMGYYFSEVTADPVATPYGVYRGGYFPATTDPRVVTDAALREDEAALKGQQNSFMFPTTGKGFTIKRAEGYTKPLLLDMRLIPQSIDKVLKFSILEPRIKEIGRLMIDTQFREALGTIDPSVVGDMLMPWLQRTATQSVETTATTGAGRLANDFWRGLRNRTGSQIMVMNVTNTLQQFTGISLAATKVAPTRLGSALMQYMTHPLETTNIIAEKSEFMRNRVTTSVIEVQSQIDDMLLNPTKYEKVRDFTRKHGYFLQTATQSVVDVITWQGAYDQAIAKGATEKDAVRASDSAVRLTQGTFAAEDISAFETGSAFQRAFTMFYSYFNMQANLLGTEFAREMRERGFSGAPRMFYVYVAGFMIPAVISEALVQAMSGQLGDDDDDDGYLDNILAIFFGGQARTMFGMIPGLGPFATYGLNLMNDKRYDDRISTSPVFSTLEAMGRTVFQYPYQALFTETEISTKMLVKDVLTTIGMATGLPLGWIGKPVGYLADVKDGKTEPTGPVDFTRGLISGRHSP